MSLIEHTVSRVYTYYYTHLFLSSHTDHINNIHIATSLLRIYYMLLSNLTMGNSLGWSHLDLKWTFVNSFIKFKEHYLGNYHIAVSNLLDTTIEFNKGRFPGMGPS